MNRHVGMPRLSVDLTGPRHPAQCQSCGAVETAAKPHTIWREHDEDDVPENVFVVLCGRCSKRLIEPHPRLYASVQLHAPAPGVMPVCKSCRWRDGVRCSHPDLRANGGPGLPLVAYESTALAHLYFGGGRGAWICPYTRPVACQARQECQAREEVPDA